MKTSIQGKQSKFTPFSIIHTIESADEARIWWHLLKTDPTLIDHSTEFCDMPPYKDGKIIGGKIINDAWDVLDGYMVNNNLKKD